MKNRVIEIKHSNRAYLELMLKSLQQEFAQFHFSIVGKSIYTDAGADMIGTVRRFAGA